MRGIYVVYLFHEDLGTVALSLNQGIEETTRRLGRGAEAKEELRAEANAIRASLGRRDRAGFKNTLSLGSGGFRQAAYEAANILTKEYPTSNLPREATLVADLARALALYGRAVAAKRHMLQANPGVIKTRSVSTRAQGAPVDPLQDFKPKSGAQYRAVITGRTIVKKRDHELLIKRYGEWVASKGFAPSTTEHPKDLVIRRGPDEWLTEAKVIRGNATNAVREAIGQLFTYNYMLHRGTMGTLALFSETIGAGYVELLSTLGIASVWWDSGSWHGSLEAVRADLAEGP